MLRVRQSLRCLKGFRAQSPGRIVDNPSQTKIVCPVVDHAQIRQHILDFCAVKEPGSANHAVRNAVSFQCKFQCIGLGIGTVQDCKVLEMILF